MIYYITGDATKPESEGNKLIIHVCNNKGGWGKGFVTSLSRRWKTPENEYRKWYYSNKDFQLGQVQFVQVENNITVANMIAQNGFRSAKNLVPLNYDSLENCLQTVTSYSKTNNLSVHMPRIGCNLAGGTWDKVEKLIKKTLLSSEVPVYVYDLPDLR